MGGRRIAWMVLLGAGLLAFGCSTAGPLRKEEVIKQLKPQSELKASRSLAEGQKRFVSEKMIPQAVASLEKRNQAQLAGKWRGSRMGKAMLEWGYFESKNKFMPIKWICAVEKDQEIIGLIGMDPDKERFIWRSERFNPRTRLLADRMLNIPYAEIQSNLAKMVPAEIASALSVKDAKLVSIHARNYYLLPNQDDRLDTSLFIPIDDLQTFSTFEETLEYHDSIPCQTESKSGSPFNIQPEVNAAPGPTTQMVGQLPVMDQKRTENCWAYAHAMVHQWWCPRNLGTSDYQTDMIRLYLNKSTNAGSPLEDDYKAVSNWDKVKQKWDDNGPGQITAGQHFSDPNYDTTAGYWANKTWNDNFNYEDYGTTWWGSGNALTTSGTISWQSNDIKSWIAQEAPVVASINADGDAEAGTNHDVVVTGYDDAAAEVYVINPNGWEAVYNYSDFNNDYWGAWYYRDKWWFFGWNYYNIKRRGMIGGMPGNKNLVKVENAGADIPSAMADNGSGTVSNISMQLAANGDSSFSSADGYGDLYRPTAEFEVMHGQAANLQNGNFSTHSMNTIGDITKVSFYGNQIAAGTQYQGAGFSASLLPNNTGSSLVVKGKYSAPDKDNRAHFQGQEKIQVYGDSNETPSLTEMRKPVKYAATVIVPSAMYINDDDTEGPVMELKSAATVYDNQAGAYECRVQITDPSGVASARYRLRYSNQELYGTWHNFTGVSGNLYTCFIPRSQWIQHVTEYIIIQVEATDADNDQQVDQAVAVADFAVEVADEDKAAPEVGEYEVEKDLNSLTFHIKLVDPSGVVQNSEFPKFYYAHKNPITENNSFLLLTPDTARGAGWFTCTVAYHLPTINEVTDQTPGQLPPFYLYWRIWGKDQDNDRTGDATSGWTSMYSEHISGGYSPLPHIDDRDFRLGNLDNKRVEKRNDWWKYEMGRDPERFYQGPPAKGPMPFPPCMRDKAQSEIGMHYYLDGLSARKNMEMTLAAKEVKGGPYYINVKHVDQQGKVTLLGVYKFTTEQKTQKVSLGKELAQSGKNTVLLESANVPPKEERELAWESIKMEEQK